MTTDIHPTKLAIMEAAVEVFIQKGFSGATTKQIAQLAGISEGAIFRHFPNKTEILYNVVDSFMPMMGVETLKRTIEENRSLDIKDTLMMILRDRFSTINKAKEFLRIILVEINYDTELRKKYYERVYKPIQQLLDDFFADGIKKGFFRDVDPNLPTSFIVTFLLFIVSSQYLTEMEVPKKNFDADDFTDLLLNGILKRS